MSDRLPIEDLNGVIIDIDGTIRRGDQQIPGASDAIEALQNQGINIYFMTNNATENRQRHAEKLSNIGIDADPGSIISSGWLAIEFLKSRFPEKTIFLVGEDSFKHAIISNKLSITSDPVEADVLLVGLDTSFDYEKLSNALQTLDSEAIYIATNTDATRPSSDRRVPSTGALLAAINTASGTEPDYITGKPSSIAIETCIDTLSIEEPSKWCMIGDRLETDITFGNKAKMISILVLTGVHSRKDVQKLNIIPDHIFRSVSDMANENIF